MEISLLGDEKLEMDEKLLNSIKKGESFFIMTKVNIEKTYTKTIKTTKKVVNFNIEVEHFNLIEKNPYGNFPPCKS